MKEIYATTRVRRRDIAEGRYMGVSLRDSAIRDLVRGLVEELQRQAAIEYREEVDPETGDFVVRASIAVAERGEAYREIAPYLNMGRRSGKTFMTETMLAPSTLTEAKLKEAVLEMKKMLDSEMGKTVFPPFLLNPLTFMDTRMERKKAKQDGEVAALLKARGEKQVRENTKKRGVELKIEVGVRKITMPDKKEAG